MGRVAFRSFIVAALIYLVLVTWAMRDMHRTLLPITFMALWVGMLAVDFAIWRLALRSRRR